MRSSSSSSSGSASRLTGDIGNNDEGEGHGDPNVAAVGGELLLFSGRAPVTRGAPLGFCWGERTERRHLVLLSRVTLDDPSIRARARAALSLKAEAK